MNPFDDTQSNSSKNTLATSLSEEEHQLLLDPPPFLHSFFPSHRNKSPHRHLDWQAHVKEKLGNDTFTRRYRMRYPAFNKLVNMFVVDPNCLKYCGHFVTQSHLNLPESLDLRRISNTLLLASDCS
jgi:hypothetical protein